MLDYSINHTKKYNPTSQIIFLGDSANKKVEKYGVVHREIKDYSVKADFLAKSYKHLSPNGYIPELICLQRWVCLAEYVNKNNTQGSFILLDSDVLLYCDITEYAKKYFEGYDISLCGKFGPGYVIFKDKSVINKLAQTIMDYYDKEKISLLEKIYEEKKKYKQTGIKNKEYSSFDLENPGISDMTLIELFINNHPNIKILDMVQIRDDIVFDTHIGKGDERFPLSPRMKKIKMLEGLPYCYNVIDKKWIRFLSLHFQGYYKKYMFLYYTAAKKGVPNKLQGYLNLVKQIIKLRLYKILVGLKLKKIK